jgi:hypothetical protein
MVEAVALTAVGFTAVGWSVLGGGAHQQRPRGSAVLVCSMVAEMQVRPEFCDYWSLELVGDS